MCDIMSEVDIETPYLSEEVELKKITPIHVLIAMSKVTAWQNFTHHPTCSKYRNHYFKIGRIKLCVGCTNLYSGIVIFLILYFSLPSIKSNPIVLPLVFLYGCAMAIIHALIHPENKWIKSFLRFALGFGLGAYLSIIILGPRWWLRAIFSFILIGGVVLYRIMRGDEANLELCEDCPLHKADPPCDPMKNTDIRIKKINEIIDKRIERIKKSKNETLNDDMSENGINKRELDLKE